MSATLPDQWEFFVMKYLGKLEKNKLGMLLLKQPIYQFFQRLVYFFKMETISTWIAIMSFKLVRWSDVNTSQCTCTR